MLASVSWLCGHTDVFASNIQTVREPSVSASSILARRPCWRVFLLIYPPLLSAGLHGRLTSCSPNLRPTSGRAHNSAAGISRQLHCAGIPFSVDARALPAPVSYYDAPFSRIFPSRGAHECLSPRSKLNVATKDFILNKSGTYQRVRACARGFIWT